MYTLVAGSVMRRSRVTRSDHSKGSKREMQSETNDRSPERLYKGNASGEDGNRELKARVRLVSLAAPAAYLLLCRDLYGMKEYAL